MRSSEQSMSQKAECLPRSQTPAAIRTPSSVLSTQSDAGPYLRELSSRAVRGWRLAVGTMRLPLDLTVLGRPGVGLHRGSGTSSLREMKPDPLFRPRTSRDAGPYREAGRDSVRVRITEYGVQREAADRNLGAPTKYPTPLAISTLYSAISTPNSVLCTQSSQLAHLPAGQLCIGLPYLAISPRPITVMPWVARTEAASSCASVRTTRP